MRKNAVKRLHLNKETLRELRQELTQVAGGVYTWDFAVTCRKQPPPPSVSPCPI